MESESERVALAAAREVLDRAWGKAEARGEDSAVEANRNFVLAPQPMALEKWLERRGQPEPLELKAEPDEDDPDRKLN
jgi:hypothetical protein